MTNDEYILTCVTERAIDALLTAAKKVNPAANSISLNLMPSGNRYVNVYDDSKLLFNASSFDGGKSYEPLEGVRFG